MTFSSNRKARLRSTGSLLLALWGLLIFPSRTFAQETERINFALTSPPHFLPIWLAKDAGLFKKYGLAVEVIYMRGGSLITMGILNGELQLSGAGAESVVAAKVKGGDVTLLACPLDSDLVYLIAQPGIKNPMELKGKASGVSRLGSTTDFYLRTSLKKVGLDPDKDLTILQLGSGAEIAVAFESGRIAAAALSYRNALPFLNRNWPVLLDLTKTDFSYPPSCIASSNAYVRKKPKAVEGFLKAYVEGISLIKKDRVLANRIYKKYYQERDDAIVDKVVSVYAKLFKRIPYVPDRGIETVVHELSLRVPLPKEFIGRPDIFRDNKPLEKLAKEGWIDNLYK
jgi:ABC-type nitrate/sulfonate/bicarbonate transport system substrate-binding protein